MSKKTIIHWHWLILMLLVQCIGEMHGIDYWINEDNKAYGYQICNTWHKLIFGGLFQVRECFTHELLFGFIPIWTKLIPWWILPRCEGSCIVYKRQWYRKQNYPSTFHDPSTPIMVFSVTCASISLYPILGHMLGSLLINSLLISWHGYIH